MSAGRDALEGFSGCCPWSLTWSLYCGCLVTKSCLTLCDPLDCSPPGFFIHGVSQARILEQVAIAFSRGSSRPRDWTRVSCPAGRFFYHRASGEVPDFCESECKTFSDGRTHYLFCELICSVKYCEPVASLSLFTNFVSLVSDPSWAGSAVQHPVKCRFLIPKFLEYTLLQPLTTSTIVNNFHYYK